MNIIVLDLECNQPSNKIIEIGAVLTNVKTGLILNKFHSYINPNEEVSEPITALTGIDNETLVGAKDFTIAIQEFFDWCDLQAVGMKLGAWGGDVDVIRQQCSRAGVSIPKRIKVYDIKQMSQIFRIAKQLKPKAGLKQTLDDFELSFEGEQHRALDDALNTAKLLHKFYQIASFYEVISKTLKGSINV